MLDRWTGAEMAGGLALPAPVRVPRAGGRARTGGGWWPPTTSPTTTARASCTSPRPSARTTPRWAGPRTCPSSTRSTPTPPSTTGCRRGTGASSRTPTPRSSPTCGPRPARGRASLRAQLPHCWRCGTPLIYWAKTSWFVRTEERRGDLLAQNETIGWYPEHQARPLRALARGQHRLGPVATATGARPSPSGGAAAAGATRAWVGGRAVGPGRARPVRPRPPPALRRRDHLDLPARGVRARSGACRRSSTPGSTRAPCPRRRPTVPTDRRARDEPRFPADFICEAIDQTRAGSTRCWR